MSVPVSRPFCVVLMAAFGFAGGEAAGFHTGIHAAQWAVISGGYRQDERLRQGFTAKIVPQPDPAGALQFVPPPSSVVP